MSTYPQDLLYTKEHEWVRFEGNRAHIGITSFAQSELGDIVFVELPAVGKEIHFGDTFGTVESVKTVSDLFAPVTGKIVAINEALQDAPEKVNEDPFGEGWMIVVEVTDKHEAELLTAEAYQEVVNE